MEHTAHTPTIRLAAALFSFPTRRSNSTQTPSQTAGTRAPLTRDEVAQMFGTELYGSRNR